MLQQRVGDLLEIEFEGKFYYVVVLTKIVQFGGNILFAFHTDGGQTTLETLLTLRDGFNICSDLLLPKRTGVVRRLHRFDNLEPYWRTDLFKACHEHRRGVRANLWFIRHVDQPDQWIRLTELTPSNATPWMMGVTASTWWPI